MPEVESLSPLALGVSVAVDDRNRTLTLGESITTRPPPTNCRCE